MTWKHYAIIFTAFTAVVLCGHDPKCNSESFNGIVQLATLAVGGALGHAGSQTNNPKTPPQP